MANPKRGGSRYKGRTPAAHEAEIDLVPRLYNTTLRYVTERRKLGELNGDTPTTQRSILTRFARHAGEQLALQRVGRAHVTGYLMWREESGVSANARYTELSVIRAFCRWCAIEGLLRHDPTFGITGPRRPRRSPRDFKPEEVAALLGLCDERWAVCVLLGVQEGCRRAEIQSLAIEDVDLDKRILRVCGKGNKERFVPLSDQTAQAIETYLRAFPASPGAPLIRSYTKPGLGITTSHFTKSMTRIYFQAGVKQRAYDGKAPHGLRHTCANDRLDQGDDIRVVQQILGHEHLSTTTDFYLRRQEATGRLRESVPRTY